MTAIAPEFLRQPSPQNTLADTQLMTFPQTPVYGDVAPATTEHSANIDPLATETLFEGLNNIKDALVSQAQAETSFSLQSGRRAKQLDTCMQIIQDRTEIINKLAAQIAEVTGARKVFTTKHRQHSDEISTLHTELGNQYQELEQMQEDVPKKERAALQASLDIALTEREAENLAEQVEEHQNDGLFESLVTLHEEARRKAIAAPGDSLEASRSLSNLMLAIADKKVAILALEARVPGLAQQTEGLSGLIPSMTFRLDTLEQAYAKAMADTREILQEMLKILGTANEPKNEADSDNTRTLQLPSYQFMGQQVVLRKSTEQGPDVASSQR